jgi:large exoprotein involved in heme utilization and adhesion
VSVPIGLQFGTTATSIRNVSRTTNSSGEIVGLQVQPGKTLALVGGNVTIRGGNLQALGGRVELGGVAESGTVGMNVNGNNIDLSFPDGVARADVSLTNAFVDVTAGDGGSIALNARNLDILGNSKLAAGIGEGLGTVGSQAGDITLNATGAITVGQPRRIRTTIITNEVGFDATGNGGDITIKAGSLLVIDSAFLSTISYGQGDAGSISVQVDGKGSFANTVIGSDSVYENAGSLSVQTNGDISFVDSLIGSSTFGKGNAGSISVQTNGDISFVSSFISSATLGTDDTGRGIVGQGDAGSIFVQANGNISFADNTQIDSSTTGEGNAGSISVQANGNVSFADNTQIDSSTTGEGNAGSISVQTNGDISFVDSFISSATLGTDDTGRGIVGQGDAGSVLVQANGDISFADNSRILNYTVGQGDAGSVSVQANGDISFADNSRISNDTAGQGDAGSVSVQANGDISFADSFISSDVLSEGEGRGGNINIQARSLFLSDGAELSSATQGSGNAGNIQVEAKDSVTLSGVSVDGYSSGLFTSTDEGASSQGGAITVRTGVLRILDGAVLSARTRSDFDGGEITVDVNTLEIRGGGQMLTTAFRGGHAGSITVNAIDSITISGSDPTYSDRLAKFGGFTVDPVSSASGLFSNTNPDSIGQGGSVRITTGQLIVRDGAQATVSSTGSGIAGSLIVEADFMRLDNQATISADTSGGGGNINLYADDLILRRGSSVTTNARGSNITGGNITIDTDNLVAVPQEDSDISANAQNSFGGRVIVNASGIFGTEFGLQDTPLSDITASSELGSQFNGLVELNTPDIDPSRGLANLPVEVVDASNQIDQTCAAGRGEAGKNEFIIIGRGGLPSNPYEMLSPDDVWEDVRPPSGFSSRRNSQPDAARTVTPQPTTGNPKQQLVEAQGWGINDKGQVVLTATASTATPHNSGMGSATCPSS